MIPHPVATFAAARPDHPAWIGPEGVVTARALADRVARRAAGLLAEGVRPGSRVGVLGEPGLDLVVALWAVGWVGGAVLVLPASATEGELAPLRAAVDHLVAATGPEGEPIPPATWAPGGDRLLVATSGTTGAPRIVGLTTEQLLASAFGSAARLGVLPTDRWVCVLPLHHVGGASILFRSAWYQTSVVFLPRFDVAQVDRALEDGASGISLVPTMLERLLDHRSDRPFPGTLRFLLLGGAASPRSLLERARRIGAPVARTWGMTEAASQIATAAPGDWAEGVPPLSVATVEARDDGRLVVRGPLVRGELVTADRGRVVDGRVVVEGRVDDVLIRGGENIDPAEVEAVLLGHPAVREAAVVGVPDPAYGEVVAAFLVGEPVPDEELAAWCRQRLSRAKVPARWVWREALPRTELGKVQRRKLREG